MTIDRIQGELGQSSEVVSLSELQHQQEAAMLLLTGDFEQLSGHDVDHYAAVARHQENQQRRMTTEIYSRYAMAGSCLFFALLGGPFAILQAKRQFITSFIMCFLPILLVYYPVMFLMMNLCKTGTISPWWSMWVPNAIIAAGSVIVLRKVVQH